MAVVNQRNKIISAPREASARSVAKFYKYPSVEQRIQPDWYALFIIMIERTSEREEHQEELLIRESGKRDLKKIKLLS